MVAFERDAFKFSDTSVGGLDPESCYVLHKTPGFTLRLRVQNIARQPPIFRAKFGLKAPWRAPVES